jgi:uncharacterized protein (TIGR03083 family)
MHDWLALLGVQTARFAEVVAESDLHLGGVHQWAAHAVAAGSPQLEPEAAGPLDPAALADWYAGHAGHLIDVLSARPADAPAWAMDPTNRTAGFWRRRQVHETTLHLWDADLALGAPRPIDPPLAWDGVLEVVDVVYPRQVRLRRIDPLPGRLRLRATDGPWSTNLGEGEPLDVAASAEVLLRLLWHRADPADEGVDPRAGVLLTGAVTL